MGNTKELINDTYENKSQHLGCVNDKELVGAVRVSIDKKQGIISKMAIKKEFQKKELAQKYFQNY
jgi:hypothetical protein